MPLKDKKKRNAYLRKWEEENKEKVKEYHVRYLENNPKKKLLKSSKANAKIGGLEHTITVEDIVIPEVCPYLGIKLSTKIGDPLVISLDRIDSSKGYIPGNIQVISKLANQMKSNATKEQLITFANNVLRIYT